MSESMVGRVLAERYRIVRELGEGGMGSVFEAEHLALGRKVAIKVLLDEHTSSADFRARFEREAQVLSGLSHPNIVTVTDFGFDGDAPFLVMDLIGGRELHEVIEEGLPPNRAGEIIRQLLRAMAHAHASGLVHRDLKPANIFVQQLGDGSDHVTVLDFGLARQVSGGTTVTKTGLVLGTPAYMSPEQSAGESADARSDVYSLGVLIFEILAGRRPFPQSNPSELMRAHLLTPAPPLSSFIRVDAQIEALVLRALSKEAPDRFADAGEMLGAFDVGRVSNPQPAPEPAATKPAKKMVASVQSSPRYDRSDEVGASKGVTASRIEPVGSKQRSFAVPLAMIGFGVALIVAALMVFGGDEVFGEEPEPVASPPVVVDEPNPVPHSPDPAPEPNLADRWADPGTLAPMLERLRAGASLSRTQERRLGVLIRRADEGDARAAILLAHSYASKRNLTDALERYREAFERDASIVNEPWVREDLIAIAAAEGLNREASVLIVERFDAEFAVEIEAAAAQQRQPWRGRLERLAAQLR